MSFTDVKFEFKLDNTTIIADTESIPLEISFSDENTFKCKSHSEENIILKGLSVLIQSLVSLPPFLTNFCDEKMDLNHQ